MNSSAECNALTSIDRVAFVFALLSVLALLLPFLTVKANRIAAGENQYLYQLLQHPEIWMLLLTWWAWLALNLFTPYKTLRLLSAVLALFALIVALGLLASIYTSSPATRITPGGAFWVWLAVFLLSLTDNLVRFKLYPWQRLLILAAFIGVMAGLFMSGLLDDLAVMREYAARQEQFWDEGKRHLQLSFGSLFIALGIGLPLGIACFEVPKIRAGVLQTLSLVQTIPSLALFGLLMAPLAWLGTHTSWAAALGISGIGIAPALIALVIYSLLPIVANTVVGLNDVSPAVRDAGRGMGLSKRQMLLQIEMPLALPVILTGIRIVLVQAIGLVTVAALVGGGGFGAFVFQGIGQTATDLVLLGALPTVFLAFVAAMVLDAVVDSLKKV